MNLFGSPPFIKWLNSENGKKYHSKIKHSLEKLINDIEECYKKGIRKFRIGISDLEAGTYVLRMVNGQGTVWRDQLIKHD